MVPVLRLGFCIDKRFVLGFATCEVNVGFFGPTLVLR